MLDWGTQWRHLMNMIVWWQCGIVSHTYIHTNLYSAENHENESESLKRI